jgi:hypothetical protein
LATHPGPVVVASLLNVTVGYLLGACRPPHRRAAAPDADSGGPARPGDRAIAVQDIRSAVAASTCPRIAVNSRRPRMNRTGDRCVYDIDPDPPWCGGRPERVDGERFDD